ncbi:MAG: cytochrome c peroxidase [Bacteroidota bacterium]
MIRLVLFALASILFVAACQTDPLPPPPPPPPTTCLSDEDLSAITYAPVSYEPAIPTNFPPLIVPPDNQLTEKGVELGRKLFYDPILSADSTKSCFSCHQLGKSFTDGLAFSPGIDGTLGERSSMALVNLGFTPGPFFWDGRTNTLEEQALLPVEDPVELHDSWENVVCKLSNHSEYPELFREAFGISNANEITKELTAKALAQFERTMISGDSRFDKVIYEQQGFFTDDEWNGYQMFFDLATGVLPDAECGHCHNAPLFTTNQFRNNGLDEVFDLNDFPDLGLGAVTGNLFDNGKFRIPTLRNVALTAPYMHDGRFETLEEVIDHYNSGGNYADNLDPLIYPIGLDSTQKAQIFAFLHTLTDLEFTNNVEAFGNPF